MFLLRRLLWRYDRGQVRKHEMPFRIEEIRGNLITQYFSLTSELLERSSRLVLINLGKEFESHIGEVDATSRVGEFNKAVVALTSVNSVITQLSKAATAAKTLQISWDAYNRLLQLVDETPVKKFSTIALVYRSLERAEEVWNSGLFCQSHFVADIAMEEAIRFLEVDDNPEAKNFIQERLTIIERSCSYLSHLPWPELVEPVKNCTLAIQTILSGGRILLAEDLTSELESIAAPQVEFSNLLITQASEESAPIQFKDIIDKWNIKKDDLWRPATCKIVSNYLAEIFAQLPTTAP